MKTTLAATAMIACISLPAFMAPAEQQTDYQARKLARVREMNQQHLPFLRRLINKFPAAEFSAPVQPGESNDH